MTARVPASLAAVVAAVLGAACGRSAASPLPGPAPRGEGSPGTSPSLPRAATAPLPPGEVRLAAVPEYVKLAEVQPSTDGGTIEATGKVAFDEGKVSRVASPVSGRVVELRVQVGDRVRRGDPLVLIASPDAESAVADFVAARADEAVAQRALERANRLYADRAVSLKEVQQAEGDATKSHAARTRAEARLEVLGIDPEAPKPRATRYALRAPIDGVVVERAATQGMEVRADTGAPLATVADLGRLWVLADVYERDLSAVFRGEKAEVRVAAWPGRTFTGVVTHVGDLVDPQSRTVKVRVEVQNPDQKLKPEMFARVTLRGAAVAPALAVPSQAVLSDGAASAVVVALGEGRFQRRTIEAGPERDGHVRVLAGLAPGERVVVDGAIYLSAAAGEE